MAEPMSKAGKVQGESWHIVVSESKETAQRLMGLCQKVLGRGSEGSHWLNLEQWEYQK